MCENFCRIPSPLGEITLAGAGDALTGLWFAGQAYFAATLPADACEGELPVFDETRRWLDCYFSGGLPSFCPKLAPQGSAFRRAVWDILLQIPRGSVMTYGAIAARLSKQEGGNPTSARAVGGAVAHNPISILIPCHRVIGANGSLTGYAGGLERKTALLRLEGYLGTD